MRGASPFGTRSYRHWRGQVHASGKSLLVWIRNRTQVFMREDGDLDQGWAVKVYSDRHGRWEGLVVLSDRAWLSLVVGRRQGIQGWL